MDKNITIEDLHRIVNDYYSLEDALMQYAYKKFISQEDRGRFYLKDLRFDFYNEPKAFLVMKDAYTNEWYTERYFPLYEFVDYINDKERRHNE